MDIIVRAFCNETHFKIHLEFYVASLIKNGRIKLALPENR
jgi:hypothetical protein